MVKMLKFMLICFNTNLILRIDLSIFITYLHVIAKNDLWARFGLLCFAFIVKIAQICKTSLCCLKFI